MSIKQTRVSLKGMSDEEKRERKKIQMREYMNKRRKEDPEFAEKLRENCRVCNKKNLRTNNEKTKQYNAEYYLNKKNKLIELEELKKSLSIAKI